MCSNGVAGLPGDAEVTQGGRRRRPRFVLHVTQRCGSHQLFGVDVKFGHCDGEDVFFSLRVSVCKKGLRDQEGVHNNCRDSHAGIITSPC